MIKVILFDVGETLVHDGQPFPHVVDALETISRFQTESGEKLIIAIVSDFGDPDAATTEAQIRLFEDQFAAILRSSGLETFFRPFEARVTISARAGAFKPDRRIFETAARRATSGAALSECLFITEARAHLDAARNLGLSVLGFGANSAPFPSFSSWDDAPLMVAEMVTPDRIRNHERALSQALRNRMGIGEFKCLRRAGESFQGQGRQLMRLDQYPELGELDGAFVEIPVDLSVRSGPGGRIQDVSVEPPGDEELDEAAAFVQNLVQHGRVAVDPNSMTPGTTHAVETDQQGRRVIVRQRFS